MNDRGLFGRHLNQFAILGLCSHIRKQGSRNHYRTAVASFCNFGLQFLGKVVIAFAGNDGQHIRVKHGIAQHIGILAFTFVIHTKTHTASHFLTLLDFVRSIFQRTNLEHIGVIPTFLQGRVRKDETYRTILTQQTLFILHNQVEASFFILALLPSTRFHNSPFSIDREVAIVNVFTRITIVRQETGVFAIRKGWHKFLQSSLVFLLKYLGILSFLCSVLVIDTVILYMVNKEQRQHLDMLGKQLAFPFQMRLNCFTNLHTAHQIFVGSSHHFSLLQCQAVQEMNCAGQAINAVYHIVVIVFMQSAALFFQVEMFIYQTQHLARTVGRFYVKPDTGSWISLADNNFIQKYITVGCCRPHLVYATHFYLLHQFLVEGIDGIKTEHEVIDVIFAVRSTVKQFEERMKELDTLTGGILLVCSQHTLRLVDNQDRVGLSQNINRSARTEFIATGEDDTGCSITLTAFLVLLFIQRSIESLGVNHHHMDTIVLCKTVDF